tara:strand:+ start:481 stop:630 length:150 start_codon:yes stop_codon:yes gene_type:complete
VLLNNKLISENQQGYGAKGISLENIKIFKERQREGKHIEIGIEEQSSWA